MIEMGSIVTDKATGLTGMVTNLQIEMNGSCNYVFQPRGLNPKTRQPVGNIWAVESRLTGGVIVPEPVLPKQVLGTLVEDKASGFKGVAVSLMLYLNGCVHLNVQPEGIQEDGSPVEIANFDIRRLKGEAIKPMTKAQQSADERERPSPMNTRPYSPGARPA